MRLDQVQPSASRRILVYGPPKAGKTTLVGQLASKFQLKWLDLEKGVEALITNVPKEYHKNIEVISLPDTRDYPIAIETTLKLITGAKAAICEQHGKILCPMCKRDNLPVVELCLNELTSNDILVIDSATQLTNSAMAAICKGKGDDYKPDWDDWAKLGVLMDRIFSYIQQAKYHVIVISHETLVEMEDGKKKLVPIAGSSNFSKTFAKYFDDVVYTELVNKTHRVGSSTGYSNNILTGSRSNVALEKTGSNSLLPLFGIDVPNATTK